MIGVDDLEFLPVHVEPPRHAARLAQRQQLLHPAAIAAEIDEADIIALRIGRMDAHRAAPALLVIDRRQRDHDRPPGIGHVELAALDPVDPARWQVERHVDHARNPQPVERFGERGADALQGGDLGKQWIEDLWAHDYVPLCNPSRHLLPSGDPANRRWSV